MPVTSRFLVTCGDRRDDRLLRENRFWNTAASMVIDRFRDGGSLSAGGTFCRNGGRWKRLLVRLQFPAHGPMVVEVNAEPNFLERV
jgi:hypothetical protein